MTIKLNTNIQNRSINYKQIPKQPSVPTVQKINEMLQNLDKHTLAIYKNGQVKYYNQRNLKPVFLALEDFNYDFKDCYIVDRRISKASALLFAYGNARRIRTPIMTKSAQKFFTNKGIICDSAEVADSVFDKNSKIKCPLEKTVLCTDDPDTAYKILKEKVFPKGIEYEKQFYNTNMSPEDYKQLDKKLNLLYMNKRKNSFLNFKGGLYNATAFIQSHTLLNRGLTNIGGCAIPNAIMSNTKEEALERMGMSALSVTFAFIMPLLLLPRYNKFFLYKNGIVQNFLGNEKKIIQVSKEYLTKDTGTMIDGIKQTAKQLKTETDFDNILERFKGKEEQLMSKLLKAHEQILRSDFISTGLLMGSIPWIATGITEYKTGRKGFSATFNMLEEKEISKKEHRKSKLKRLTGTLAFAFIPGIVLSRAVTKGLSAKTANIIKNNAQNFNYTSGVSMSKTVNAMKWAFTGFLAKLPSSRDKYELRDRTAREGATFVMFFGGDFLINNILGRLSDRFLGTKIMNTDKHKGKKIGFIKSFFLPVRRFKKINMMKNIPPDVLRRTKNVGAVLYWVSLLTNMAVLGFTVPHFLNKLLKYTVEKDKSKKINFGNNPTVIPFNLYKNIDNWITAGR